MDIKSRVKIRSNEFQYQFFNIFRDAELRIQRSSCYEKSLRVSMEFDYINETVIAHEIFYKTNKVFLTIASILKIHKLVFG